MKNKASTAITGTGIPGLCCAIELQLARLAGHALGQRLATAFKRN